MSTVIDKSQYITTSFKCHPRFMHNSRDAIDLRVALMTAPKKVSDRSALFNIAMALIVDRGIRIVENNGEITALIIGSENDARRALNEVEIK